METVSVATPVTLESLPGGVAVDSDGARVACAFGWQAGAPLPLGAVRPRDLKEIQAVIAWANQTGCPIVPISSPSGPRSLGSAAPSRRSLIVDLTGMDRIIHIDGREAVAVIEPGVTFEALDAKLKEHGLRSFKPLLPRRGKSVLSTYLDRTPITSPHDHWDSEDPMGGTEFVFGSGETFRTGTAAVGEGLEKQLRKGARLTMAMGPSSTDFLRVIQGSQGTLGVAAWSSIFCEPVPALERAFFVGSETLEPIVDLAYRLLWRRTGGQLFIINAALLGMIGGSDAASCAALTAAAPRWILYVNLTCGDYRPAERMAYLTADLIADAKARGLTASDTIADFPASRISSMQTALPTVPYKDRLHGAHRDLFFLTQLDKAEGFAEILLNAVAGDLAAYEMPGLYIQPRIQGVSAHFEAIFPFDPLIDGRSRAAAALVDRAAKILSDSGAFFSRPHGNWSELAFQRDPAILPFLEATKDMFDPHRVLSPGRLCLAEATHRAVAPESMNVA